MSVTESTLRTSDDRPLDAHGEDGRVALMVDHRVLGLLNRLVEIEEENQRLLERLVQAEEGNQRLLQVIAG